MTGVTLPFPTYNYTVAADITGTTYGITSPAAATITNPGHIISGGTGGEGIIIHGGAGTITNETGGSISGPWGVILTDGGSVTNDSSATIQSSVYVAVYSNLTASASVVNTGTITGETDGVALLGGGSVTNEAGATITGTTHYGVYVASSPTVAASVTNAGSITGATNAIAFGPIGAGSNPGGADTVTLMGGSSLSGNVVGSVASGATNTLILEAGGTGSTTTTSLFVNFGTVDVDANANWVLSGASTFTTVDITGNSATLSLGGGSTSAVISGTSDTFTESVSGGTVTISGTGDIVTVNGTGNTITVENPSSTTLTAPAGNIEIYAPTISGTVANQATTSEAAVKPFSGVTIGDLTNETDTDTLTITVGGTGGTLTGTGLVAGTSGVYTITGTASTITTELKALSFAPTAGTPNSSSTTTFKLSDVTSLYSTPTVDTTTSVVDTDGAVAPTITGTKAGQTTTSEASIKPFSGATIGDKNASATDALTITLSGGGTLSGTGLSGGSGVYSLAAASAATITSELEGLTFTPVNGVANTSVTTTFTLSDKSSAFGTATVDSTTTVIDSHPAGAPTIAGTVASQPTTSEAPVKPFSGVTIGDTNSGATETLTITLGGTGGVLSGTGLSGGTGGVYTLSGTASTTTSELEALSFTPTAVAPNTSSTTTFKLSDLSSAFATPTVNTTTSVVNTDGAVFFAGAGNNTVYGGGGDVTVYGGTGSHQIYAGDGNDLFIAGSGNDVIVAGNGRDLFYGGSGNDSMYAGSGNDTFVGGSGTSLLEGGGGSDYFYLSDGNGSEAYGGSGNSVFIAGSGNAVMIGGSGNDTMFGGPGNDYFYGGSGNDEFFGGAGVDVMVANGAGNDYFDGGTGVNYYFGGKGGGPGTGLGHDTFVLSDTGGATQSFDVVQDWTEGKDHVNLSGTGFTSFKDLLSHSYQNGAYFVIQPDANHAIWLNGATAGSVAASDFSIVS